MYFGGTNEYDACLSENGALIGKRKRINAMKELENKVFERIKISLRIISIF